MDVLNAFATYNDILKAHNKLKQKHAFYLHELDTGIKILLYLIIKYYYTYY
jgi:hypothetical protein